MDIVFCIFKYFPYGGQQRDFFKIASLFAAEGLKVHVLTSEWQSTEEPPSDWNVHIFKPSSLTNHQNMLEFSRRSDAFIHKNFEHKPLVLGFTPMPFLTHYFQADRCFAERFHHLPWYLRMLRRYRSYLSLEKSLFQKGHPALILQLSSSEKPLYQKYYQTEDARFHALPPGISPDRAYNDSFETWRQKTRQSLGLNKEFVFIQIGSGFKTKGLDRSITALASLNNPEVKLLVVGQDNEEPYKALAKQLGVSHQVQFLGGRDDIPKLLAASDAMIHPARYENAGMALLEGLVAGLPVICTDSCGYASYISDAKAGIVLPSPFEQSALNNSVHEITNKPNSVFKENAL